MFEGEGETIVAVGPGGVEEVRPSMANDIETFALVESLRDEAHDYRSRNENGPSLEDIWEANAQRFLGNQWGASRTGRVGLVEGHRVFHAGEDTEGGLMQTRKAVVNRTQTSLISNVAAQTQQAPVVQIVPVETADKPDYMLSKEAGALLWQMASMQQQIAGQAEQLATVGVDAGVQVNGILASFTIEQTQGDPEHGPVAPITPQQNDYVQTLIDAGQLPQDAVIAVNDTLAADCAQTAFDNRWAYAYGDRAVVMNEYLCNIFGHQPMRFQWHGDGQHAHHFTLENSHILNVWCEGPKQSIEEVDFFGFDYLLSLDKAKIEWPALADDLTRAATEGTFGDDSHRISSDYARTNFRRKMVRVRICWLRHQMFPMGEEEAVESGKVIQSPPVLTEHIGEDGVPIQLESEPESPYQLADATPTAPGAGNWPMRAGIRQIITLPDINRVAEDVECPYLDIPFAWNVNIPIPYSIFGQGEPQRLEDLQAQVNRLVSILVNYTIYFQFPQRYWKKSVLDRLKATGVKIHSRPGAEIPLPDEDYDRLAQQGRMCMVQDIPIMPPQFIELLQLLLNEMDRMSGNSDVRQGVAPTPDASGRMVEALQAEAHGPLSFRSKFTEWMIERIARIALDAMVRWMPENEWREVLDRYELPVVRMVIERLANQRYNVTAESATGRGSNQQQTEQRTLALYQSGMLSKLTAMEKLRIPDPEEELQKIQGEQMVLAATGDAKGPQEEPAKPAA
jgi:hypothetical protein